MKKIVRLTETDLTKLVRRVIKEQEDFSTLSATSEKMREPKGPYAKNPVDKQWYDSFDYPVDEPTDYTEEMSFGLGEYEAFKKFIKNCDQRWCLNVKRFFDEYAKRGDITVRK